MRPRCGRCFRPPVACYCHTLQRFSTTTKVVFVQHPKESKHAVGTARMAHLALENSELFLGIDFSANERLNGLLFGDAPAAILYPGPQAINLSHAPAPPGPWTVLVVDGTWSQAYRMLMSNPAWQKLPQLSFDPKSPSRYRIRREPKPEYVSTVEATAALLELLEDRDFSGLLAPFDFSVEFQLQFAGQSAGGRFRQRRSPKAKPRLSDQLRPLAERLVAVQVEKNAAPHPERLSSETIDAVHVVAERGLPSHEPGLVDLCLQPRQPLGPNTAAYIGLSEAQLRATTPSPDAALVLQAILRPDDLLVAWGRRGVAQLQADGILPPLPILDLRSLWAQDQGTRACGVERLAKELNLSVHGRGRGRAGQKLGALAAVLRALVV